MFDDMYHYYHASVEDAIVSTAVFMTMLLVTPVVLFTGLHGFIAFGIILIASLAVGLITIMLLASDSYDNDDEQSVDTDYEHDDAGVDEDKTDYSQRIM